MERIIRTTLAALAALTAIAGCRNVEQELPEPASVKTVQFHAATAETRTAFTEAEDGVYQTLWTENDSDVLLSLNYGKAEASAITASADGKTASFAASFDAAAATSPYTFYAVSPASAARAISPSRSAWSVYIAAEQTPSALSVDEAAQLLVAKSAASAALPDDVDLHFSHLTAYGRITLKNLELGDAKVRKVELVFSTPVVGEWYWGEDGTIVSNGASHTITLNTDASEDLWFACAPVSVGGATMALSLYTDQGVLQRVITFPEKRQFASGKVARFSVDMAGFVPEKESGFVRVTEISSLHAGDKILIVNEEGTYALGAQNNSGTAHRDQVSVKSEDGVIADPGKATVLTLEDGSEKWTWALNTGTGYLAAASSKNALVESNTVDGYSSWTIRIVDGVATVSAQEGSSKIIRHNPSATRFSCYTGASSSTKNIVIYRKAGSAGPMEDDPLTAFSEYGCYLTGAERTYVKGSDQLSRNYPSESEVRFSILNAASKEQLVVSGYDPSLSKGASAQVTVHYRKGTNTILDNAVRNLTVVKEDGPKVWLGDGTGQGLIIKK